MQRQVERVRLNTIPAQRFIRLNTVSMSIDEARQQAQAEKLTLLVAENKSGFFGVHLVNPGTPKPYQARVYHGGKTVSLGMFATAEEAALCIARTPEGQAVAAKRAAAAAPLPSEETRQQARAEELTQLVALLVKEEEGEEECSDVRPKRPRAK